MGSMRFPNGVTLLHIEPKDHNCRYELAIALGPLVDSVGTGTIIECSCGIKFRRDGELESGYYWKELEN